MHLKTILKILDVNVQMKKAAGVVLESRLGGDRARFNVGNAEGGFANVF